MNPIIKEAMQDVKSSVSDINDKYSVKEKIISTNFHDGSSLLSNTYKMSINIVKKILENSSEKREKEISERISVDNDVFILDEDYDNIDIIGDTKSEIVSVKDKNLNIITDSILQSTLSFANVNKEGFELTLSSLGDLAESNHSFNEDLHETLTDIFNKTRSIIKTSNVRNFNDATQSKSMEEFLLGNVSISNFSNMMRENTSKYFLKKTTLTQAKDILVKKIINASSKSDFLRKIIDAPMELSLGLFDYVSSESINDSKIFKWMEEYRKNKENSWVTKRIIDPLLGNKYSPRTFSEKLKDILIGKGFDTGKINLQNSRGLGDKVDFDAETHTSLNTVITGYLSRILSGLTGQEMIVNDYDSGEWITPTEAVSNYKEDVENTIIYNNRIREVLEILKEENLTDYEENINDLIYTIVMNPDFELKDLLNGEYGKLGNELYDILSNSDSLKNKFNNAIIFGRSEVSSKNKSRSVSGSLSNAFNDNILDKLSQSNSSNVVRDKVAILTDTVSIVNNLNSYFISSNETSSSKGNSITDRVKNSIEDNITSRVIPKNPTEENTMNSEISDNNISESKDNFNISEKVTTIADDIFNNIANENPNLNDFNPFRSNERLRNIEELFRNSKGFFSDTIDRLNSGKKVNTKNPNLFENLAQNMTNIIGKTSDSMGKGFMSKIGSLLTNPKFMLPVALGGLLVGGRGKLFNKFSKSDMNDPEKEKEHKRGFLTNIGLNLIGGGLAISEGVKSIREMFTSEKADEEIESSIQSSKEYEEENEDDIGIPVVDEEIEMSDSTVVDEIKDIQSEASLAYGKDFKESVDDMDAIVSGEKDPYIFDDEQNKEKNEDIEKKDIAKEDLITSIVKMLSPISVRFKSLSEKIKEIFTKDNQNEEDILNALNSDLNNIQSEITNVENIDSSEATAASPSGMLQLDQTHKITRNIIKSNSMMKHYFKNPKQTAKKLFVGSPLGATYTLHKFGYDMHNISGGIRTNIENYLKKLAEKAETAMIAALSSGGGGGTIGGNYGSGRGSGGGGKTVGGNLTQEAQQFVSNLQVSWIGDSLGVHVRPYATSLVPNSVFDVKSSRQMTYSGDSSLDATVALQSMIEYNNLKDYLVFIIGTNRGVTAEEIDRVVSMVDPKVKILFVDTASEVGHAESVRDEYVSASQSFDNVYHVAWYDYARPRIGELYQQDGAGGTHIHMNGQGNKLHAEFIAQALYEASMSRGNSSGNSMIGESASPTVSLTEPRIATSAEVNRDRYLNPNARLSRGGIDPGVSANQIERLSNDDSKNNTFTGNKKDMYENSVRAQLEYLDSQEGGVYTQSGDRNSWGPPPAPADCSSMVYKSLIHAGVPCGYEKGDWLGTTWTLRDHTNNGMYFNKVSGRSDAQPGDIILCLDWGHVVTYVGNDQIFHASMWGVPHRYEGADHYFNQANMIIRPKERGHVGDMGGSGGSSLTLPMLSLDEVMAVLKEPRPSYMVRWDKEKREEIYKRVRAKYFDLFGYEDESDLDEDSSGEISTDNLTEHPIFDENGQVIDIIYTNDKGQFVDEEGNRISGAMEVNLVNNYNHNETRRYSVTMGNSTISESTLNKFYKTSKESLDLLKEIEQATKHVQDGTRNAYEKLIIILRYLKTHNNLFNTNNQKSEIERQLLERFKVLIVNVTNRIIQGPPIIVGGDPGSSGGGTIDENGNMTPIAGGQAQEYDFELSDNDLIRMILTGG